MNQDSIKSVKNKDELLFSSGQKFTSNKKMIKYVPSNEDNSRIESLSKQDQKEMEDILLRSKLKIQKKLHDVK